MTEQSGRLNQTLVDWLMRYRNVLLIVAVASSALAWPIADQLQFDQSIESLYAPDDPHLLDYLQSKSLFGGDEYVIISYPAPNLFEKGTSKLTEQSEREIEKFAAELNAIPGVDAERTQSLAKALKFPFARDRIVELSEGMLIGQRGTPAQTTAIVLRLEDGSKTDTPRAKTIAHIREVAAAHNPPAYVVGEPVQVMEMFNFVEFDGAMLFWVSLGLLGSIVLFLFRSIRWMILPLVLVETTILWTESILVLSQMRLSMVSSMLNSLVTIIGIATVMHITVRYRDLREHTSRYQAVRQAFQELLPVIVLTCVTTAAGFAALLSSAITPVASFGLMMSLATLLVIVTVAMLLPGGILLGQLSAEPHQPYPEKTLLTVLSRISRRVQKSPYVVWGTTMSVLVFSLGGFSRLSVETDFSKNFRESSTIVQALEFVETRLGGAGSWEVNFPAPSPLTEAYLDRVESVAEQCRQLTVSSTDADTTRPALTKVVAINDGLSIVPSSPALLGMRNFFLGGQDHEPTDVLELKLNTLNIMQPEYVPSLYNAEQGRMRIVLRSLERQTSEQKLEILNAVHKIVADEFGEAKETGMFVLLTYLIESLLHDQLISTLLAAISICTIMSIAFRSIVIGVISLVPNLFPIVLVVGMMGWIGLPINIATAMIASVSMGLTIDSSIHYLSAYRRSRNRGASVTEALEQTQTNIGRALVFANIALMAGFSVLSLSHFIPLVYFGVLVSIAIFGGLLGNLVLLPSLLLLVDKEPSGNPHQEAELSQSVVNV